MEFITNLRKSSRSEHWMDGLQWFGWTVLCGLFPVLATIGLFMASQKPVSVGAVADKGEFLLYTASYVGGSLYLVLRDFRTRQFPSRSFLTLVLSALLVVATVFFAWIALLDLIAQSGHQELSSFFNKEFLRQLSVIALPAACMLGYLVIVTDNVRIDPDVGRIREGQEKKLEKEFDDLDGDGHGK